MKEQVESLNSRIAFYLANNSQHRLELACAETAADDGEFENHLAGSNSARKSRDEQLPLLAKESRELAEVVAKSSPEAARLLLKLAAIAGNIGQSHDQRPAAIAALWPDVQATLDGIVLAGDQPNDGRDLNSSPWVPSSPKMWNDKLSDNKELTKFRKNHPEMFRKPSQYKLEIHAVLWARYWADRGKAGFKALGDDAPSAADDPDVQEKTLEEAARRAANLRAKKKAGKQ